YSHLLQSLSQQSLSPGTIAQARRYLADLNSLSAEITRTRKAEVDERKALREPWERTVTWSAAESAFYHEYVQWCRVRAAAVDMPVYLAMQMPLRLASASLPMARKAVLDPVGLGSIRDADTDTETDGEARTARVRPHRELVAAARALEDGVDSKFDQLLPLVQQLAAEGRRALLFTFSRPTLAYLEGRLSPHVRVAVLHGGVRREERRRIIAAFRRGEYDLLLANRVASEGLDFEFCSAVINYDLPWNPMEIEQRIGRIDRIGQVEEKIHIVNFYNEETIDERILKRLLERIQIFKSSIGELEPIVNSQMSALRAAFDFDLTEEQREAQALQFLTAIEEQRAGLREVSDASTALLISNDVDVSGLEDDLVRRGKYVGQRELGLLLHDWALTDCAVGVSFTADGRSLELRGNATMAERLEALARKGIRSRAEVESLASALRGELPLTFVLDQELARINGGPLLTANNPLIAAALTVPGHRHVRYACARVTDPAPDVPDGIYVVVLGRARAASRGGDEIWGVAVDGHGQEAPAAVVDALLSALARGALATAANPVADVSRQTKKAINLLSIRHQAEQERRDAEADALNAARHAVLSDQHDRRLRAIDRRTRTAVERGQKDSTLRMFAGQRKRAEERHRQRLAELRDQAQPEIVLEPLAVCQLELSHG
ncbi:MAG: helicase-related protein, partial [Dermatophilaceae bacterium]